jgi:predicted membrane channel-forming protein YqfA (hemolysin III family)
VFSFFSMGQHAFICVSSEVATFWRRMDMSTLLLLHTTMTFSIAYYTWGWKGAIILTSLCGIVAAMGAKWIFTHIIVNGIPVPRNRLVMFVALTTLSYYIPMWQRGIQVAISTHTVFPDLIAPILVLCGHIVGLGCYVLHWPQRTSPGKYDIFGSGHQILHWASMFVYTVSFLYVVALREQPRGKYYLKEFAL